MGENSPAAAHDFPAGAYVVDLAQPAKRIAKALLEPHTPQDEAFQREQLARFARNERRGHSAAKEDYGFYDITSWSLPLAFGVEAYWTEDAPTFAGSQPLNLSVATTTPDREGVPLVGGEALRLNWYSRAVGVQGGRAQVAYLIPYDSNGAASLIFRLLREGFKLAVATKTLNAGGRDWPRGTVVVRISRNPDSLHERIVQLARETSVEVAAVNSGFPDTGETGVGSETVVSLRRPKIIVAADDAVSTTGYGAMWWTFDRMGVDFTPMTINAIKSTRLDDYNVILPDGSAGQYFSRFGKGGVEALRGWVERGGTLVLVKGAAVFGALKDVNFTSARLVGSDEDDQKAEAGGMEAKPAATPQPALADESAGANNASRTAQRRGRRQRQQPAASTPE